MQESVKRYIVYFRQFNRRIAVSEGETLLEAERRAGIWVDAVCGGNGTCGKCKVKVTAGQNTEVYKACMFKVTEDIEVYGINEKAETEEYQILKTGRARTVYVRPWIDSRSAGKSRYYMMAFDVGTTSLVGYMLDGETGNLLCTVSSVNPQIQYGADVIKRADYVIANGGKTMSSVLKKALNGLISEAAQKVCVSAKDIAVVVMVGNTCMNHLFLELPVKQLVTAPYEPAVKKGMILNAREYGMEINRNGKLIWLPNIAGFVGSDTVAAMLCTEIDRREKPVLIIDIGTNGEIALGNRHKYVAGSTAAGPALEGANISRGMRGAAGAIEHVDFSSGKIEIKIIGGGKAKGICGSGLLDAVAGMLKYGIIDKSGRIRAYEEDYEECVFRDRVIENAEGRAFVLAEASECEDGSILTITQKDVREIQLAKSAVAAGIRTALEYLDMKFDDLSEIIIAGAFGNYISPRSLCEVGIIPVEYESIITRAGNAAGAGAVLVAVNCDEYKRAVEIGKNAGFLEFAANKNFQEYFIDELQFPDCES